MPVRGAYMSVLTEWPHRGDLVHIDQPDAKLYRDVEQPTARNPFREKVRQLRKVLAGSRYEIVTHPTLGCELIVADQAQISR
jgi:hypothetical protein